MSKRLKLGDKVRVNETCEYAELVGDEMYVAGLKLNSKLEIIVWCVEQWPPRNGGSDDWKESELDILDNMLGDK